jgi:ribosomal protein S27E
MVKTEYKLYPAIRSAEDLGVACIGSPHYAVVFVPLERRISRAEYGRRLAEAEGGKFTAQGYIVPYTGQ